MCEVAPREGFTLVRVVTNCSVKDGGGGGLSRVSCADNDGDAPVSVIRFEN